MLYRCTLLRNLLLYEDCLDAVGLSCTLYNIKKFPRKPKKKKAELTFGSLRYPVPLRLFVLELLDKVLPQSVKDGKAKVPLPYKVENVVSRPVLSLVSRLPDFGNGFGDFALAREVVSEVLRHAVLSLLIGFELPKFLLLVGVLLSPVVDVVFVHSAMWLVFLWVGDIAFPKPTLQR